MEAALTHNQQRFFALLEEFPRIAVYWDKDSLSLHQALLEQDLGTMSSGESAIARFFASLWLGGNAFEFELFRHIQDCDDCAQSVIAAWVANPFFP